MCRTSYIHADTEILVYPIFKEHPSLARKDGKNCRYLGYVSECQRGDFFLILDMLECTNKPILLSLLPGDVSETVEQQPKEQTLKRFVAVLEKIFGEGNIPEPKRWVC